MSILHDFLELSYVTIIIISIILGQCQGYRSSLTYSIHNMILD